MSVKQPARLVKIVSVLMMAASVPGCAIANNTHSPVLTWVAGYFFVAGLIGWFIGWIMEIKSH